MCIFLNKHGSIGLRRSLNQQDNYAKLLKIAGSVTVLRQLICHFN